MPSLVTLTAGRDGFRSENQFTGSVYGGLSAARFRYGRRKRWRSNILHGRCWCGNVGRRCLLNGSTLDKNDAQQPSVRTYTYAAALVKWQRSGHRLVVEKCTVA